MNQHRHHQHCDQCFNYFCTSTHCPAIECPQFCGARLHSCKIDDHLLICTELQVPCINEHYGCPLRMIRNTISTHLARCPASLIVCSLEWNRLVPTSKARSELKHPISEPIPLESQLDVHLALADQKKVICSFYLSREERRRRTDHFNPEHPKLPILDWLCRSELPTDDDDSDEEKIRSAAKIVQSSPFADCLQCRLQSASQHLHTLGNMNTECTVRARTPTVSWPDPMPDGFHMKHRLFVDIVPEHLSPNTVKCPLGVLRKPRLVTTIQCGRLIRRDEFAGHNLHFHQQIVQSLDGHSLVRCPLHRLGCDFQYSRLLPERKKRLRFSTFLDSFSLISDSISSVNEHIVNGEKLKLTDLPPLVMTILVSKLDCASICSLSTTCSFLRKVCKRFLVTKGGVQIVWRRSQVDVNSWVPDGWKWSFSTCHSPINNWNLQLSGPLSNHLKKCPYYVTFVHNEKEPMFGPKTAEILNPTDT